MCCNKIRNQKGPCLCLIFKPYSKSIAPKIIPLMEEMLPTKQTLNCDYTNPSKIMFSHEDHHAFQAKGFVGCKTFHKPIFVWVLIPLIRDPSATTSYQLLRSLRDERLLTLPSKSQQIPFPLERTVSFLTQTPHEIISTEKPSFRVNHMLKKNPWNRGQNFKKIIIENKIGT
jgi:hypothetical protein